ncbi:uncharacterized protein BCR38DRAFT_418937 [Pseudomassariella vexata]|uniref:Uncharacterized protein n=1 Tax=Pseudomassariella vexata TaxID=1141098 RepID=A0A1Y2EKQ8_9PEZI|nr:uncharacterized protein BCR38DRAFT_418937 [Pseudomassariella vexata]ORY72111.1 hypothetical protein BCR38DRAFT_418937 [Pseudomassariella vexata]
MHSFAAKLLSANEQWRWLSKRGRQPAAQLVVAVRITPSCMDTGTDFRMLTYRMLTNY